MTMPASKLQDCLPYAVICDYQTWLGAPSPRNLRAFLFGAAIRAQLTGTVLSEWRLNGPLENPEFYMPLKERTGRQLSTIHWDGAPEFLHFSLEAAMKELKTLFEDWVGR